MSHPQGEAYGPFDRQVHDLHGAVGVDVDQQQRVAVGGSGGGGPIANGALTVRVTADQQHVQGPDGPLR